MSDEQKQDDEPVTRKQLKNAVEQVLTEIQNLEKRVERLENKTTPDIRTFEKETDDGETKQFIAVEPNQGEVYSANYFRKIVERLDKEREGQNGDDVSGKAEELVGEPADEGEQ